LEYKNLIKQTIKKKMPTDNERFGGRRGVGSWDTLQVFWKFSSRPSLCEPPPDRQAAGR